VAEAFFHRRPRARLILRVLTVLYGLALFVGTHLPPRVAKALTADLSIWDKLIHFVAYAGLATLVTLSWSTVRTIHRRELLVAAIVLAVLGALDEWTQQLPGVNRNADLMDWVADILGILCGLALALVIYRRWGRQGRDARDASDALAGA